MCRLSPHGELKGRIAVRDKKLDKELEDGAMETTIFIESDSGEYRMDAKVIFNEGQFHLSITSTETGKEVVCTSGVFATIGQLEKYLEENTIFRIADFVRR